MGQAPAASTTAWPALRQPLMVSRSCLMLIARGLYAVLRFLYAWSAALIIVGGICALILLIHRKVYDHLLHDGQYQVVPGPLV